MYTKKNIKAFLCFGRKKKSNEGTLIAGKNYR